MLSKYNVAGITVLAYSLADAHRVAGVPMLPAAAAAPESAPVTVRSGIAISALTGRKIVVVVA